MSALAFRLSEAVRDLVAADVELHRMQLHAKPPVRVGDPDWNAGVQKVIGAERAIEAVVDQLEAHIAER